MRGYVLTVDRDAGVVGFAVLDVVDLTQIRLICYDWADASIVAGRGGWAMMAADGAILKANFPTEAAAREWLTAKQQLVAAGKVTS